VGAQALGTPVYSHPFYVGNYGAIRRPGAERFHQKFLCLPLHVSMTEDDVAGVAERISEILELLAARGETSRTG